MAAKLHAGRLISLVAALAVGGAGGYLLHGAQPGPVPAPGGEIGTTVIQDESTIAIDLRSLADGTAGAEAAAMWLQAATIADTLSHSGLDRYLWHGNQEDTPASLAPGLAAFDTAESELALSEQGPPPSGAAGAAWAAHVASVYQNQLLPVERAAMAGPVSAARAQAFDRNMKALSQWVGTHQP
jgi:hypothetical protein